MEGKILNTDEDRNKFIEKAKKAAKKSIATVKREREYVQKLSDDKKNKIAFEQGLTSEVMDHLYEHVLESQTSEVQYKQAQQRKRLLGI